MLCEVAFALTALARISRIVDTRGCGGDVLTVGFQTWILHQGLVIITWKERFDGITMGDFDGSGVR